MENTIERRNPEHYLDLTPYDALSNMQPKAGEIWTCGDWGEKCIVIKNQGRFCNILRLVDGETENSVTVEMPTGTLKYTNPAFVQYAFNDRIREFVKKIPADEFCEIVKAVNEALGIEIEVTKKEAAPVDDATLKMLRDKLVEDEEEIEKLLKEKGALILEKAQLITEANVYKRLYEEFLARVLAKDVVL